MSLYYYVCIIKDITSILVWHIMGAKTPGRNVKMSEHCRNNVY